MRGINEKLKYAIDIGDIDFLENYQTEIDHKFEDGDTLLLYALSNPDNDIYKYLLKKGADISVINNHEESAVHSIVYSGRADRLLDVVSEYKLDINSQSADGVSPLLLSVLLEKKGIFEALIKLDADVNLPDYEGNMPIHPACFNGNEFMVTTLVEKGALLNYKTLKGNLPLALAVNGEHISIVKYLYAKIFSNP